MLLEEMIPELNDWKEKNKNFSIFDYLGFKCTFECFIAVSKLFFPDLVFVDDCIFLRDSCQKSDITNFYNHTNSAADFEKAINFICLSNLISINETISKDAIKEVVSNICRSWRMYFDKEYKEHNLIVESYEDEYDGWCVTFYQKKNINAKKPLKIPSW